MKKFLLLATLGFLTLVIAGSAVKFFLDHRTFQALKTYDNTSPLHVTPISSRDHPGYVREEFSFEGHPGEQVPVLALRPVGNGQRHPAIIFLYGIGMKMNFADHEEIARAVTQAGFVLFVPEQYGRGQRRQTKKSAFEDFPALRRRIIFTVRETRRLVDVLAQRPDIDPERIYFWGASFGAMTGCSIMAYEPRLRAGILTLCAGDFQKLVKESPYREKLVAQSRILGMVAPLLASLLKPFDPLYHIGRISPRPLLFQNAVNDEMLPESAVRALHAAAGEPKRIVWYESGHNRAERAVIEQIVRDTFDWITQYDRTISAGRADEVSAR